MQRPRHKIEPSGGGGVGWSYLRYGARDNFKAHKRRERMQEGKVGRNKK